MATTDKFKVLVIDDDQDLALNLQDILQEEGYAISIARDGKSAEDLCRKVVFGLAVVDIKLPDIGGIELVSHLVQVCQGTEFIMVTGYASIETAMAAVGQKGIIAYETKPLNIAALLNLIRQVKERQQTEKALQETEQRYRLLAENVADVIWTADIATGRLTYVSPSIQQMTGFATDEIIAGSSEQFVTAEHLATFREALQSNNARNLSTAPLKLESEVASKHGRKIFVETNLRIMPGTGGSSPYVFGVTRDISERKRAEEELRHLSYRLVQTQEEERRSVAAELHDQVGQSLTGLKLLLARAIKSPQTESNPLLDEANSVVSDLMTRVRNLSLDLRPAMLDDLGLLPALVWLFERYGSQTRIKVNFEHTGIDRQFPSEISTAIYRIVKEALNNVSKHTQVEAVTVRAWSTAASLCAQVEDKGKGFDPTEVKPGSSGLIGMQERAHLLGGQLTIETTPGAGTRVTAELPLPSETKRKKKEK